MSLAAFAGLARPEQFAAGLRKQGVNLRYFMKFPDHHAFTLRNWSGLSPQPVVRGRRLW